MIFFKIIKLTRLRSTELRTGRKFCYNTFMLKTIYTTLALIGTIIGVGLFSLPYVATRVGLVPMIGYLIILGILVGLIHIYYARLVLVAPDNRRFTGFAELYLGPWAKKLAIASATFGIIGSNLAYIIVGGSFLAALAEPYLGIADNFYILIYALAGGLCFLLGTRTVSRLNTLGSIAFVAVLAFIFYQAGNHFHLDYLSTRVGSINDWFLPYGIILFSLWGGSMIPELEQFLGKDKSKLTKAIGWAIGLTVLIYIIFIIAVMGVTGPTTTDSALFGVAQLIGGDLMKLALIFGILTTFTSYIGLGLTLQEILRKDAGFNLITAWSVTTLTPIVAFLLGFNNFIEIISFIGGVLLAVDGTMMIVMYQRVNCKKLPTWHWLITMILIIALVLGAIYALWDFIY